MAATGPILFLVLTSKTQRGGGTKCVWRRQDSVASPSLLPEKDGERLLRGRRTIVEHILVGREEWSGKTIRQLAEEDGLRCGTDFGFPEGDPDARYLPAVRRYDGRFWQAFSQDLDTRERLLCGTRHHVLLLSNVYGLVCPWELVQLHSCPLHDDRGNLVDFVGDTWYGRERPLTGILGAYAKRHGITRLIDLTADRDFRDRLISWGKLLWKWERRGPEVLVGCGVRASGADALPALGHACRDLLHTEEDQLLALHSGTRIPTPVGDVVLRTPLEAVGSSCVGSRDEDRMRRADLVARRRRGAVRFMDCADGGTPATSREGYSQRLRRLHPNRITSDEERCMDAIEDLRRGVEYENRDLADEDRERLERASAYLSEQACVRWPERDIPELR